MNEKPAKKRERRLKRPDPNDIIYTELNLEHWPELWATTDGTAVRTYQREIPYPDGSRFKVKLSVEPSPTAGDITTDTLKAFSVMLKLRQEALPKEGDSAETERIPLTLRKLLKRLTPGRTQLQLYGGRRINLAKKKLRKLQGTTLRFTGSFWDATADKRRSFEIAFSIVSDYFIAEEKRFRKGQLVQLPLELGYFRLNDLIVRNLNRKYVAPVYLTERLKIRNPFALQLFNFINLKMGSPQMLQRDRYQRSIKGLFEEDFPSKGRQYPYQSDRLRILRRCIKELQGRKITTGVLRSLTIETGGHSPREKLVVRREPFPLRLVSQEPQKTLESGFPGFPENVTPDESLRQDALVEDILQITRDEHSRRFYNRVAQELQEHVIRRFISEIKADEAGDFRGTPGKLFWVKVRDWCQEQGREPFWKSDPGKSETPENP